MAYTATMTREAKPRSGVALGGIGAGQVLTIKAAATAHSSP